MSVLASKLPEVNIVELVDTHTIPSIKPVSNDDDRLAWLEAQVNQLKQWRESVTSSSTPLLVDGAASPAFSPNSPRSSSSVTSEDLPQLVSSQTLEPLSAPTSNLPKKTASKKDEPLPVRILNIIETYGHNEPSTEGTTWLGRGKFESIVRNSVDANIPIEMVLPAFPWKSVNRVEKVTGALPDLGEELALARLQSLCEDIQAIYDPGAYVTVTSDGLVYCDLVGIPAEEVYEYGKTLRNLAAEKGYDRLKFIRIMNLLGLTDSPHMTKEEYLASVESSRQALVEKYLPAGFDVRSDILNDTDINLTYCGYIKFLTKDLKHSPITAGVKSNQEYRRVVKRVAHDMITRGKAFAALIAAVLPHYVRLSIHRSTGLHKLSVPLIPQPNHFSMTPWHCSVAVTAKGQFRTVHASEVRNNYDLVEKDGRPYYFRDRSDIWKWESPVEFDFIYPKGIVIKASAVDGQQPKFGTAELKKVKEISKVFSPVIPLGFV